MMRAQAGGDVAHRLLPGDALELARAARALQRVQDAVGVVLHVRHRDALRARVALRERMVAVGAQLRQAAVLDRGDHAAQRLADATEGDPFLDRHASVESTDPEGPAGRLEFAGLYSFRTSLAGTART